MKPRFKRLTIK